MQYKQFRERKKKKVENELYVMFAKIATTKQLKLFSNLWNKKSELALFQSAANQVISKMHSAPAANRTRHVGYVTCAVPLCHVADNAIGPHVKNHLPHEGEIHSIGNPYFSVQRQL